MLRSIFLSCLICSISNSAFADKKPHNAGEQFASGEGWTAHYATSIGGREFHCNPEISRIIDGDEFTEVPVTDGEISNIRRSIISVWEQRCGETRSGSAVKSGASSLVVKSYVKGVFIKGDYTEFSTEKPFEGVEQPLNIIIYHFERGQKPRTKVRGEDNGSVAQTIALYQRRDKERTIEKRNKSYRANVVECGPTKHAYPATRGEYVESDPWSLRMARRDWLAATGGNRLFADRRMNRVMFCEYQFFRRYRGEEPRTYLDIVRGWMPDHTNSTGLPKGRYSYVGKNDYYWLVASLSVAISRVCKGNVPGGALSGDLVRELVNKETGEVERSLTEKLYVPKAFYDDVSRGIDAFRAFENDALFTVDLLYAPATQELQEMLRRTGCQSEQITQYIRNLERWTIPD